MRKISLGFVLAFLVTLCSVGFISSPAAYAASVSHSGSSIHIVWTHTTTKVVPASKHLCTALIKQNPALASNPQACNITIVSKDILMQSSSQAATMQPNSCPSGNLFHDVKENSNGNFTGAEMHETFNYAGNCDYPSVAGQNCTFNMWAYFPFSQISNGYCGSWNSNGGTVAEGDYVVNAAIGSGTYSDVIESSASKNVMSVTNSSNF
ncbi:MAG: hypothetical protein ABI413_20395 [Ktedonobacteraceae bacterium]